MILNEIIKVLEKRFPISNKEEWDNVGLMVGRRKREVKKIQLSLDVTTASLENAIKNNVDLIISHHPMIFSGVKKVNSDTILGEKILTAIENNIAIYSLHTNLDSTQGGLNDYVGEKLNLKNGKIIDEVNNENFGIGRIYSLENKITFEEFVEKIKSIFLTNNLRVVKNQDEELYIKKIAIVNGSGSSYWRKAKKMGADLLITGDIKYHEALDSLEEGFCMIDIGHYETEHFFGDLIRKELEIFNDIEIIDFNDKPVFNKI